MKKQVVSFEDFQQAIDCVNAWTELFDSLQADLEQQPDVRFSQRTTGLVVAVGNRIKALEARHAIVTRTNKPGVMDA